MTAKQLITILLASLMVLSPMAVTQLHAEDTDEVTRSLGLSGEDVTAVPHSPRPASLIAENVTVIGAEEIARINAHTVADVLQTVPGVQVDLLQTPGGIVLYDVLGSTNRHVLVQIDGVPQNFVGSDNVAHIGSIPVQMIERIEIIKGAASAAWGSALGGVINIVTKLPAQDTPATGLVSASIGKAATSDLRGEISGSGDRLGYYVTGGKLKSNGLIPGNDVDFSHGFGKLSYDFLNGGRAILAADARYADTGLSESYRYNFAETGVVRYLNGYFSVKYPLAERLSLEANLRGGKRSAGHVVGSLLPEPSSFMHTTAREVYQGYEAALNWGDANRGVKAGAEYERTGVQQKELLLHIPNGDIDTTLTRYSAYLNGTYTIGRLSVLPGARYDRFNLLDNAPSATLGATFRLTDNTLLRGYAAYGYSMPLISNYGTSDGQVPHKLQRVRTVQGGIESTAIPYLWFKVMLFDNEVWNIQTLDRYNVLHLDEQSREGVDMEWRTSSLYGFMLSGGYTFIDARDKKTGKQLSGGESGPRHATKWAVTYDNQDSGLTCVLSGNYSDWNLTTPGADSTAMLLDLHVTQKLAPSSDRSPELFFSVRNILDNRQYQYDFRPVAPRWFEFGGRLRF
ncbi:TonB-dependent receptor plug domain-containing protein [Geomonas edaphica]|uniref:TonB-dependent receptor plug domain-containing protein n=1 Tax=Geomonas edaphica TaxID=2570226 RepID=UPI001FECBE78|nr:TonB-dependent receptor plug domain-containing protein [Geomonas edaphica]